MNTAPNATPHPGLAAIFAAVITALLGLALTGCATPQASAQPQWVQIYQHEQNYTFYIDAAHITPSGENPAWQSITLLMDVLEDSSAPSRSVLTNATVDCNGSRIRPDLYRSYTGHMGAGELVRSEPGDGQFIALRPDTAEDLPILRAVCQP